MVTGKGRVHKQMETLFIISRIVNPFAVKTGSLPFSFLPSRFIQLHSSLKSSWNKTNMCHNSVIFKLLTCPFDRVHDWFVNHAPICLKLCFLTKTLFFLPVMFQRSSSVRRIPVGLRHRQNDTEVKLNDLLEGHRHALVTSLVVDAATHAEFGVHSTDNPEPPTPNSFSHCHRLAALL